MGVLYSQASFKNSRVASRKPTTQASTIFVDVASGATVKAMDVDITRTYMTILNTSYVDQLRYAYSNLPTIGTNGFPLDARVAADLESPQELWIKNMGAALIKVQVDFGQG